MIKSSSSLERSSSSCVSPFHPFSRKIMSEASPNIYPKHHLHHICVHSIIPILYQPTIPTALRSKRREGDSKKTSLLFVSSWISFPHTTFVVSPNPPAREENNFCMNLNTKHLKTKKTNASFYLFSVQRENFLFSCAL